MAYKDLDKDLDLMIEQVATARGLLYDILQGLNKLKKERGLSEKKGVK